MALLSQGLLCSLLSYTYHQLPYQVCRTWKVSKVDHRCFHSPSSKLGWIFQINFIFLVYFLCPSGFSQDRKRIYISNRFKYKMMILDPLDYHIEVTYICIYNAERIVQRLVYLRETLPLKLCLQPQKFNLNA